MKSLIYPALVALALALTLVAIPSKGEVVTGHAVASPALINPETTTTAEMKIQVPHTVQVGEVISPFVVMGKATGSNVNREFAQKALDTLNAVVANGCLEKKVKAHAFKTLERDLPPKLAKTESEKAWNLYVAHAPYSLDLRWYRGKLFSKTIGYTYYYKAGTKTSETRIWSNTKFISSPERYAAHLAHEKAHQANSGAFGHWSRFGGSFPYDVGNMAGECIRELK